MNYLVSFITPDRRQSQTLFTIDEVAKNGFWLPFVANYTASNLGLLLQKEQNVKWGEGPSGKQAVGKTMEHGKSCWHIFSHK